MGAHGLREMQTAGPQTQVVLWVEEDRTRAEETVVAGRKEEAWFDSQMDLAQLRRHSDALNVQVPFLHHSLLVDCSMEGRRVVDDGQGTQETALVHETREGTMEGDSMMK
jgi:hypothetical protein